MSRLNENQSLVRLTHRHRMMASSQVVEEPVGILGRDRGQESAALVEDPQESMLRTDRRDGTDANHVGWTVESGNVDVLFAVQADLAGLKDDFLTERAKMVSLKIEYLNPVVLGIRDI